MHTAELIYFRVYNMASDVTNSIITNDTFHPLSDYYVPFHMWYTCLHKCHIYNVSLHIMLAVHLLLKNVA